MCINNTFITLYSLYFPIQTIATVDRYIARLTYLEWNTHHTTMPIK